MVREYEPNKGGSKNMPETFTLEMQETANPDFSQFLKRQIRAFNDVRSPWHRAVRGEGSVRPLNIMVVARDGQWLGGLAGEVYWDWLEVNDFWLHESLRGSGLGRMLLRQMEALALERGARKAFLTTFSFQARAFYEKQGYEVVGTLPDYPPGESLHTLLKRLGKPELWSADVELLENGSHIQSRDLNRRS